MIAAFGLGLCACADNAPGNDGIDLLNPEDGEGIVTAAQLVRAVEEGAETITLAASIDLEDQFLKVDVPGSSLSIDGKGFSITGNGDCVIRLEDGCSLTLTDVTITAGSTAIGCLGSASVGGKATINSVAHAINAQNMLSIAENSRFYIKSNVGSGIYAEGLELLEGARVLADGRLGGVDVTKDDITLYGGAVLDANTDDNYYALKCAGTLVMYDGAAIRVTNKGDYHGAEISDIFIDGTVSIEAKGGPKGVGLFMFELNDDYCVVGSCEPEMRFETGDGSLGFYESADAFPTPEPSPTPDETDAGGEE